MRKVRGRTTVKDRIFKSPIGKKVIFWTGLGSLAVATAIGISHMNSGEKDTVATVRDLEGDPFEGKVPLFNKNGEVIANLEDGAIVYVDGIIRGKNKGKEVKTISEDGTVIEGIIPSEYLNEIKKIREEVLEKYDTIYRVIPKSGANIRKTPRQEEGNKIDAIAYEEYVLGSTKTFTDENKFLWVPIIHVNEENEFEQGFIRSDLLELMSRQETQEKTSDSQENIEDNRKKKIVDTSKDGSVDLKLRSDTVIDKSNIITTIPNGSTVYIVGDTVNNNKHSWVEVEYTDNDGNIHRGWVVDSYLKDDKIIKIVDTTSDNYHDLNLREHPGLDGKIIATIKHGTELELPSDSLKNIENVNNLNWIKVTLPDGTTGYVSYSFLRDKTFSENQKDEKRQVKIAENQKDAREEVAKNVTQNKFGKVVGIDISSVTASELRDILKNTQVPTSINGTNTEDLQGDINYVYIKLGASSYGKNNPMQVLISEKYVEQAKVCEEFGVPFGFYYYSTCVNSEEAQKEANSIKEALDSVKGMKYNLLPFAIDVELANNDRQAGLDTTEAKATLANSITPDVGRTIVYTAHRAALSGERIFDLNRYNDLVESGPVNVWASTYRYKNGKLTPSHQEFCNYVVNDTDSTLSMVQGVIDINLDGVTLDIDKMDLEAFINLLSYRDSNSTRQTNKNMDMER